MLLGPHGLTAAEAVDPRVARLVAHTIGIDTHNHIDVPLTAAEVPGPDLDLAGAVSKVDAPGHCTLIDCLTLWLANLLCPADGEPLAPARYQAHIEALEAALGNARGKIIAVSNEIGLGVVPLGAATRLYVDELGRLNQRIAALSTQATLMVAGLPLALKPAGGA